MLYSIMSYITLHCIVLYYNELYYVILYDIAMVDLCGPLWPWKSFDLSKMIPVLARLSFTCAHAASTAQHGCKLVPLWHPNRPSWAQIPPILSPSSRSWLPAVATLNMVSWGPQVGSNTSVFKKKPPAPGSLLYLYIFLHLLHMFLYICFLYFLYSFCVHFWYKIDR